MAQSKQRIAVIGLGRFGSSVARELVRYGDYVLGMDMDEHVVAEHASHLDMAVQVDARSRQALSELDLENYSTVVIGVGEALESSVLATMNAREFGCGAIWAKARDKVHERVLRELGATHVFLPESDTGEHIAHTIHNPFMLDYLKIGDQHYVAQLSIPERRWNTPLADLGLRELGMVQLLGVKRGSALLPVGSLPETLEEGDSLILSGDRPALRRFGETI